MTRRHGLLVLLGVAVLAAASGVGRLRLDPDVLGMLPGDMPEVRGLRVFQQDYARQDELVLLIEGGGDEEGLLADYAGSLAAALESAGLARRVRWNPEWTEQGEGLAELLAYLWLNGDARETTALAEKFSAGRAEVSLAKSLDAVATAMDGADMVMRANDPLGLLGHPSVERLVNAAGEGAGGFESPDGRGHLLLVDAPMVIDGYRDAESWVADVRMAVERWRAADGDGLMVRITGEPAFSAEIGGAMERDMRGTAGITMALVGLLFWWMQKRLRLLAGLLGVLVLTFLTALGLAGWIYGELSVMAAGFAAVLIGLAVDYGVLICQEAKVAGHDRRALFRATSKSIVWASVTTAAVFVALNRSGLPGIAQLGTMVACGILAGAVLMLGIYLPFVAMAGAGRGSAKEGAMHSVEIRRAGWTAAGLALAAAASLAMLGLPGTGFDAKMMRPRDSAAMAGFERVRALFPHWNADELRLVVEADGPERMRDRLAEAHRRCAAEPSVASLDLPVGWWPDDVRQQENRRILAEWLDDGGRLLQSASDAGFSDEGLALTKAVLSAMQGMTTESAVVYPKSAVAGEMMRMFVNHRDDGSGSVLGTLVLADGAELAGADHGALRSLAGEGIWPAGWALLQPAVAPLVRRDLTHVFLPMALLMVALLALMFRTLRETLLVVAALCLSGLLLLAVMAWAGLRWNFLNIAATPLLLGIGIDYGIHIMMALRRNGGDRAATWHGTGKAVVFCGCSTAIGFGSLCLASNDALASLGAVAVIGILISMLVSVLLLPAWSVARRGPRSDHKVGAL